ncbi:hypothetical protein NMY22_g6138 [Coprinellus aureogranulatus]|nr:hypothetical protein NMY22_g6138 [Coprinellus aureogranulatus]
MSADHTLLLLNESFVWVFAPTRVSCTNATDSGHNSTLTTFHRLPLLTGTGAMTPVRQLLARTHGTSVTAYRRLPQRTRIHGSKRASILPAKELTSVLVRVIGVSCVVVSIGTTATRCGQRSIPMVARVTLTDYSGYTILDTYVRPTYQVTDYRSSSTGLNHAHLQAAPSFSQVQDAVARSIHGNIIVGHRIWDFLSAVDLTHPAINTRDMALYRPLRKRLKSKCIVDLPTLMSWFLAKEIGGGYENSRQSPRQWSSIVPASPGSKQ